ncbi:MAG: LamG domain-containing protein, partial [Zoogloea sp.]|nr:LamG domain-containing protein [Zoogloea sp.]
AASLSAATATTQASLAAGYAASAQSVVQQNLSVVDTTVFPSAGLVDVCVYDTSRDSDGGAWRKRCADRSWYQEVINGKWLGVQTSEVAARAVAGAATGDYYYNTAVSKFFSLNASSGSTEVFRGNSRDFPARALITAEQERVVIWDLTQPGAPMWMVFVSTVLTYDFIRSGRTITSIAAGQGAIFIGTAGVGDFGVVIADFIRDKAGRRAYTGSGWFGGTIRNRISGFNSGADGALANIVSGTANDIALTVRPDAPFDPVSGLPAPTIAVATDGGVSVIKQDGTVSSITGMRASAVALMPGDRLWAALGSAGSEAISYGGIPSTDAAYSAWRNGAYNAASVPASVLSDVKAVASAAEGGSSGLIRHLENPAAPSLGMVAYSTTAYASGWLPGDARGAWITASDGVTETITDAELLSNGGFDADSSGWAARGAQISVVAGALHVVAQEASPVVDYTISTIVGRTYAVKCSVTAIAAGGKNIFLRATQGVFVSGVIAQASTQTVKTVSLIFVATAVTTHISIGGSSLFVAGDSFDIDNVSVKGCIADRSVKGNNMTVIGSLTKAPVNAGGLCSLSGFSAANYLEQPYNADFDFGTGDFCVMGWVNTSDVSGTSVFFERADPSADGSQIAIFRSVSTSSLRAVIAGVSCPCSSDLVTNAWVFVALIRRAGVAEMWVNGVLRGMVSATGSVSLSNAITRIGINVRVGSLFSDKRPATAASLAAWRIGATAPNPDQIAHIYNTEKKLFDAGAQCAIDGTSSAVTALAYDDETDLLHVGTSWGRSAFRGLVRVASEATPVGSIKALAASCGAVAQAGASAADVYVPAYLLREELERLDDAARVLGSRPIFVDSDAAAAQTAFSAPAGYEIRAVYLAGVLKRAGTTKDYMLANDGFKWSANFAVAPGAGAWVSLMVVRAS